MKLFIMLYPRSNLSLSLSLFASSPPKLNRPYFAYRGRGISRITKAIPRAPRLNISRFTFIQPSMAPRLPDEFRMKLRACRVAYITRSNVI